MQLLPVGAYEITTDMPGFKQQVWRGINLVVGQEAVVNLTLEVGAAAEFGSARQMVRPTRILIAACRNFWQRGARLVYRARILEFGHRTAQEVQYQRASGHAVPGRSV